MGRALYALLVFVALHGGELHSGYGPRYSKGVMERVARVRDLPQVGCMVSSPYWPIGTWVWVAGLNTGAVEHCRVTDVSQKKDRLRHIKTRRVAELGYNEALTICGVKNINKKPEQCPILVIKLHE